MKNFSRTARDFSLGLVTSKNGGLDRQNIIERIHEAAQYHPLDKLCLSPQCGFASTEEGNILTADQQWAKLKLVKSIAEEVGVTAIKNGRLTLSIWNERQAAILTYSANLPTTGKPSSTFFPWGERLIKTLVKSCPA